MKTEELSKLLGKYYSCTSTSEEEMILRAFFSGTDVPDGYEAEKAIFSYLADAIPIPEPSPGFETSILAGIDESEHRYNSGRFRKYLIPLLGTAAGLLILAGSWFFFNNRSEPRDTFTDPELAYAESMKILMSVSLQLNKGAAALEPVGRINRITTKSVEKSMKNLEYLQKAVDISAFKTDNN